MDDPIEAAYRAEHARLWRALVGYCRDQDLATEAEAEAWSQAIARGSAIANPAAWVWTAAFKIASGMLVDKGRRRVSPSSAEPLAEESPALVELLDLLGELSDQQRACVVLCHVGGLKPADVAAVLGTSSGSVRVQLHRAHRQLKPAFMALREDR